ncbi:MAG: helix-turn-helix transcriptional regulator [Treponema sp.]|nr:helix-turn-helix transcriptional regulator [Treponema sp.]
MNKKLAKNETKKVTPDDLSPREKAVFDLLLKGTAPKSIAAELNISYTTVLTHQKNIYRKLGIQSIHELFAKYLSTGRKNYDKGNTAVFIKWNTVGDDLGSEIEVIEDIEKINEEFFTTYTLTGKMSPKGDSYIGALFFPDSPTLEAMKQMTSFSFKYISDGQPYEVKITTAEGRLNEEYNFYSKVLITKIGEISTVNININELAQNPFFGQSFPFNKDNIECFLFQPFSNGKFNIKIWDIRFQS